jgi:RNA polymerase I-specific transcription initiation factor RRN6
VFIKSSLSPLATSFRFNPDESSPQFLRVADATKLVLPELSTTASALTFQIQPAEYGESVHHEQPSGPGKAYRDLSIRFFVATAIASDMAVVQKLYYASPNTMTKSSLPDVTPPDWRGRLVQSYPRVRETDFIEQSLVNQGQVNTREEQDGILSSHVDSLKSARDDWTMLYELSHARATGAASKTEDFSHIISRTEEALQTANPADSGHKLLSELFDEQILVPDIDQAAAEFKDMISSKTNGEDMDDIDQMLQLARVGYSTLDLGPNNDMDLMAVYDNIMAHWLTPLSQTVPGRVRLVKEQLARRIAAGICLASHVLRQPLLKPNEEMTPDTQATEDVFSFPQSSLPTPSPTATPSMTTVTSLSSHPSTLVSSEFARLQRYTTFSSEKSTPAPLPKGLTNTLAHWSLGSNPDKYDWLAVQREQEKRAEEEDEDLTPKERARLKRRAEKLLLKQRREAQKASAMDLANSQVPGIVSASQPAFMNTPSRAEAPSVPHSARAASQGTQLLASSQAPPNMFTSQIQPGKFGGKPAKKKRRVVGF